eukprot:Sspe_Gene.5548::Locus_1830_Transcript_2_2_Confidence_0.750_Length_1188::g.5548::m.5548
MAVGAAEATVRCNTTEGTMTKDPETFQCVRETSAPATPAPGGVCANYPCKNNGSCSADPADSTKFVCDCSRSGHTGSTCAIPINYCSGDRAGRTGRARTWCGS